jgi:hypothetical protein
VFWQHAAAFEPPFCSLVISSNLHSLRRRGPGWRLQHAPAGGAAGSRMHGRTPPPGPAAFRTRGGAPLTRGGAVGGTPVPPLPRPWCVRPTAFSGAGSCPEDVLSVCAWLVCAFVVVLSVFRNCKGCEAHRVRCHAVNLLARPRTPSAATCGRHVAHGRAPPLAGVVRAGADRACLPRRRGGPRLEPRAPLLIAAACCPAQRSFHCTWHTPAVPAPGKQPQHPHATPCLASPQLRPALAGL